MCKITRYPDVDGGDARPRDVNRHETQRAARPVDETTFLTAHVNPKAAAYVSNIQAVVVWAATDGHRFRFVVPVSGELR
jgi:hypothetical protein